MSPAMRWWRLPKSSPNSLSQGISEGIFAKMHSSQRHGDCGEKAARLPTRLRQNFGGRVRLSERRWRRIWNVQTNSLSQGISEGILEKMHHAETRRPRRKSLAAPTHPPFPTARAEDMEMYRQNSLRQGISQGILEKHRVACCVLRVGGNVCERR